MKETKELVKLIIVGAHALDASLEDGKISFSDFSDFIPVFMKVNAAIDGFKKIGGELKAMTDEQRKELQDEIRALDLGDKNIEYLIEEGMLVASSLYKMVGHFQDAKKQRS